MNNPNCRKLSVIIPVHNEKGTILEILKRVEAVNVGLEKEIIIIDDGSTDGSTEILKTLDSNKFNILITPRNNGRGAAIKMGLSVASGDIIMLQDADLEYSPLDYPSLIEPILLGKTDVVIGSRQLLSPLRLLGSKRVSLVTYFGHAITTSMINFLYHRHGTDYYGCYKVFYQSAIKDIAVKANGFDFDSELLCRLFRRGARIIEVPISYTPRKRHQGKKISWLHGFSIVFSILKWRFIKP